MTEALGSIEESRQIFFDGIVKLHFKLVELTSNEEWAKLAKSVNKLY